MKMHIIIKKIKVKQMSEFLCPTDPKHTLKLTDNDSRFEELTCVSCGSKVYKPYKYSQKSLYKQQNMFDNMPETYNIASDWQIDIVDDEESLELLCRETNILYYQLQR